MDYNNMSLYSFSKPNDYQITTNNNIVSNNYQIDSNYFKENNKNNYKYETVSYEPISNEYKQESNIYQNQNIINDIYQTNNNNLQINDFDNQINNNIYEINDNNINNIIQTDINNNQTNNNFDLINDNTYQNNNIININNNEINDNNNNYQTISNKSFDKIINEQVYNPIQNQEMNNIQIENNIQNFEINNQINDILGNQINITEQNNIGNDIFNQPNENAFPFEINTDTNNINTNEIIIQGQQNENNIEIKKEEEKPPLIDKNINYSVDQYTEILKNILDDKAKINSQLEDALIQIIEKTTHSERQQMRVSFYTNYSGNLILTLKKEMTGNFKDAVLGSFLLPSEYDTYSINSSFKNNNQKKELILSEIIGSRSSSELSTIKKLYISNYRKLLKKDIISETSGDFQKFLLSLLLCNRSNSSSPNPNSCANDASDLYQAGEKKRQNDEDTFIRIFTTSSPIELAIINHFYKQQTGKGLLSAITTEFEFCKETKDLLETIVRALIDKEAYYAKTIKDAITEGNDAKLIRVICSRHSVDLNNIKKAYKNDYQKELIEDINDKKEENWGKIIYSLVDNAK